MGVKDEATYQAALAAVTRATEAYRAALSDDSAISVRDSGGVTPWASIYRELLAELRESLRVAGQRYDRVAEGAAIPVTQRFDWRGELGGAGQAAVGM